MLFSGYPMLGEGRVVYGNLSPLSAVAPEDFAFTPIKHNHAASNNIYYMAVFDNGWIFIIDLFHYTYGFFEKWGMYVVITDPEGRSFFRKGELNKKALQIREDRLFISDGNITFEGDGSTFRIVCDYSDFSCDITVDNHLSPWKERDGYHFISPDRDVYVQRIVTTPWGKAFGTITVSGKSIPVQGHAYGDRSIQVFPPLKLDPLIVSLRLFSSSSEGGSWQLNLLEHRTHRVYGSARFPQLWIGKEEKWLYISGDYSITFSDFIREPEYPYEYPRRITLFSSSEGAIVSGTYTVDKMFNFTDVINEIPEIIRPLASIIFKRPVFFRCLGEFSGQIRLPGEEPKDFKVYGPMEYVIVR